MYYLLCFFAALGVLIWVIAGEKRINTNMILLAVVTVVGDGGYLAMSNAANLESAILANMLTYAIGIFAPMFFFLNICDICKIKIPNILSGVMIGIQLLIYLSLLTIGKNGLYYKEVEFHLAESGSYLTKVYGPMHTLYLISMFVYSLAAIITIFYFSRKKNIVSSQTADTLILIYFLLVGSYVVERLIHLNVELMPFIYTTGIIVLLFPIKKLSKFSIEYNNDVIDENMRRTGYIAFSNKLSYMGSNIYAKDLFPELSEWDIEKKIPGNGGRFNTFLRPSFMKYVESESVDRVDGKTFEMQNKSYHCEFSRIRQHNRVIGYMIQITNIIDYSSAKEN